MPWFAKYDGIDGSSQSDDARLPYDLMVPSGQNPDQAATFTAIALAESGGGAEGSSRLFVGNLSYDSHQSSLDSSAVATLHNFDFFV